MEKPSREHEASIRRARSEMIRRHVTKYGSSMGLGSQLVWLGVAEAELELAEALELPALQVAS